MCVQKCITILLIVLLVNHSNSQQSSKHLWEAWEIIPSETFLKIFLFNVTNPDEFELQENAKPKLEQIGPYVFLEKISRTNVSISEDGSTASYNEVKSYEFMEQESNGTQDDLVNVFNLPLLTFGKILGNVPYVGPNYFKSLVKSGERLIRRKEKVGDVLYFGTDADSYVKVLTQLGAPIPEQFSDGRFGLFKGRNGTSTGELEVETGNTLTSQYGHISSYKGQRNLTWWKGGGECSKVRGTMGTIFDPSYLSKYHINVFEPEACRSLKYSYHGICDQDPQHINGFKYLLSKDMFQDAKTNSENLCYCSTSSEEEDPYKNCYKSGIMDLGPCQNNAPLAMSLPHFYEADEIYVNGVEGLNPEKDFHKTYFIVEPNTGVVIKDVRRFQINIQLKPIPSLAYMKNVTEVLLPVFWTERKYILTNSAIEKLKEKVKNLPVIGIDEHGGWYPTTPSSSSTFSMKCSLIMSTFVLVIIHYF